VSATIGLMLLIGFSLFVTHQNHSATRLAMYCVYDSVFGSLSSDLGTAQVCMLLFTPPHKHDILTAIVP
jgi:hypothetical protein